MTPGALAIVMVTRSVRKGSSGAVTGMKPVKSGGRKAMEYCRHLFRLWQISAREEGEKIPLTEHANRGNVNDCFDPLGTKSSPRRVRVPGPETSPAAAPNPAPASSCDQNTALATLETNVLLLRRAPRSSAAPEPIAMVLRRQTLGALASMSSAVVSVPWRVRNRGMGELLANVNW